MSVAERPEVHVFFLSGAPSFIFVREFYYKHITVMLVFKILFTLRLRNP